MTHRTGESQNQRPEMQVGVDPTVYQIPSRTQAQAGPGLLLLLCSPSLSGWHSREQFVHVRDLAPQARGSRARRVRVLSSSLLFFWFLCSLFLFSVFNKGARGCGSSFGPAGLTKPSHLQCGSCHVVLDPSERSAYGVPERCGQEQDVISDEPTDDRQCSRAVRTQH